MPPIYPNTAGTPARTTLGPEMLYFSLKNCPPTEESIQIPLFCHTKRTSQPKMLHFWIKNAPNLSKYLRHRCQEHSRPGNHYKKQAKQGPDARSNFLSLDPEPTGNPSKNPQKHLKKPLPPPWGQTAGRRAAGWVGWAGLAGWRLRLGWLGWLGVRCKVYGVRLGWARLGWADGWGWQGKELDFDINLFIYIYIYIWIFLIDIDIDIYIYIYNFTKK